MLSEEEKKAIEILENLSEYGLCYNITEEHQEVMKTIINLITKLQKENEEKDKYIKNSEDITKEMSNDINKLLLEIKEKDKQIDLMLDKIDTDTSNENNIKYVDLVFENCEVARLYPDMFKYLVINDIAKNKKINCFQYKNGECSDSSSCSYFAITLLPKGYNKKMDWINQSLKERLKSSSDITSVYLTYNNGEEEGFLVPWKEGNEYINEYQIMHEDEFEDNTIQIEIKK